MENNKKVKLIEKREERGLTQKDMSEKLNMSVSGYCKRENGQRKISISEWGKSAKILNCPIEDIYEEDEKQSWIFKENSIYGNHCAKIINLTVPEDFMKTHLKYIQN